MQTLAGGRTLVKSMIEKHGSYEGWCEWMRKNGSKGGKVTGIAKGFALNRELAREAGRKGGTNSKRRKGDGKKIAVSVAV